MKDLILYPGDENEPVIITAAELQDVINYNEPEDVIGVEEDIKKLFKQKYTGTVELQVHVRYLGKSPAISTMFTADERWWL